MIGCLMDQRIWQLQYGTIFSFITNNLIEPFYRINFQEDNIDNF